MEDLLPVVLCLSAANKSICIYCDVSLSFPFLVLKQTGCLSRSKPLLSDDIRWGVELVWLCKILSEQHIIEVAGPADQSVTLMNHLEESPSWWAKASNQTWFSCYTSANPPKFLLKGSCLTWDYETYSMFSLEWSNKWLTSSLLIFSHAVDWI